MAKIHHPDRVANDQKAIAKEKFAIIHHAYLVLSNGSERKQYDSGSDFFFPRVTRSAEWEQFLKPATNAEMNNARLRYQNSAQEQRDIEREFQNGKGSMTHVLNYLPFMRVEDESRVIAIIKRRIADRAIPLYKIKKIPKK